MTQPFKFKLGDEVIAKSNVSLDDINALSDELYYLVGRCLGAWSSVERHLTILFLALLDKIDNPFPLAKVFDGVVSFEVRISILNLAIQNDPKSTDRFKTQWNALFNKLSKSYKKRHEVAHFAIVADHTSPPEVKVSLQPFFSSWSGPGAGLTAKDLRQREESFLNLADRIDRFWWHIALVRGQRDKCPIPINDPDHLLDNPFVPLGEENPPPPESFQE